MKSHRLDSKGISNASALNKEPKPPRRQKAKRGFHLHNARVALDEPISIFLFQAGPTTNNFPHSSLSSRTAAPTRIGIAPSPIYAPPLAPSPASRFFRAPAGAPHLLPRPAPLLWPVSGQALWRGPRRLCKRGGGSLAERRWRPGGEATETATAPAGAEAQPGARQI